MFFLHFTDIKQSKIDTAHDFQNTVKVLISSNIGIKALPKSVNVE